MQWIVKKGQNLTGRTTTVKSPTQPLIGVDQIKPCGSQGYNNMQHRVGEPQMIITRTLSHQDKPHFNTQVNQTNQPLPLVFPS